MKYLFSIITIIIFLNQWLNAQNVEFEKKNFPDQKDAFKEAKKNLKEGNKLFDDGVKYCNELIKEGAYEVYCNGAKLYFDQAVDFFLKAQEFNPNNARLNFQLGICYQKSIIKDRAIPYLEKAYKLNNQVDAQVHYYLGRAYHLNMEWDKAIMEYQKQLKSYSPKEYELYSKLINKLIAECNNGIKLQASPVRVFSDNIGNTINTPYPEYNPLISADESIMFFTARKPESTGGKIDPQDNLHFEDIYITFNENGTWSKPLPMLKPINTKEHDAVVGLSPDGQHIFLYKYKPSDGGDIYQCDLEGEEWSKPKKLSRKINTDFHESSASFSYDMQTLYYVSDMPGGKGGRDIYVSQINEKGKWDKPQNIGPTINTEYDEEGVFMHPDGKTLYFSSKGHNSMGGYDIFKVTKVGGIWGQPVNIGYPINTPGDDVFFYVNASGTRAYYTSAQKGGLGEKDIYVIHFLGPEKPLVLNTEDDLFASLTKPVSQTLIEPVVEVETMKLTLLKGTVLDAVTKDPILATIELIDNEENKVLATFTSNSKTGKFLVSLPSGKNYGIAVKSEGYLFHSENFVIPDSSQYQEIEKEVLLKKVEVGSKIVLKNIFFDFDKATLRKESFAELDRLAKLLNDIESLTIEIGGHTDSKGSDDYNMNLSQKRAQSVVNYLVKNKGIAQERLQAKGYGETEPIATNDTDEGRQQNRRTEFKILSR